MTQPAQTQPTTAFGHSPSARPRLVRRLLGDLLIPLLLLLLVITLVLAVLLILHNLI